MLFWTTVVGIGTTIDEDKDSTAVTTGCVLTVDVKARDARGVFVVVVSISVNRCITADVCGRTPDDDAILVEVDVDVVIRTLDGDEVYWTVDVIAVLLAIVLLYRKHVQQHWDWKSINEHNPLEQSFLRSPYLQPACEHKIYII